MATRSVTPKFSNDVIRFAISGIPQAGNTPLGCEFRRSWRNLAFVVKAQSCLKQAFRRDLMITSRSTPYYVRLAAPEWTDLRTRWAVDSGPHAQKNPCFSY